MQHVHMVMHPGQEHVRRTWTCSLDVEHGNVLYTDRDINVDIDRDIDMDIDLDMDMDMDMDMYIDKKIDMDIDKEIDMAI
jgi:hypothetical protein